MHRLLPVPLSGLLLLALLPSIVGAQPLRDPATVDSVAELERRLAAHAGDESLDERAAILKRLAELQPHVGRHRYELAATAALRGDRRSAYDTLLRMHGQGYAYRIEDDARFEKISDTQVWQYLVANYEANRRPFGEGAVAFAVDEADQLLESMAWDGRHQRWLFGGMRSGRVLARDDQGKVSTFIEPSAANGLWSVLDLAVDAARGKLWVASAATPLFSGLKPEHVGMSGLFRFDLESGALEKRWLIPPDGRVHAISSLAVGRQGEVYALDGLTQTVYVANEEGMRAFFGSPAMQALRSLAVSADGRLLYVADYDAGILVVDLAQSRAFDLKSMPTLTLDGIESLHVWNGNLVLVQSGTEPAMRVMQIGLAEDGLRVTEARPVVANHEAMRLPVSGAVRDDALYFIANSRKRTFGDEEAAQDAAAEPVQVFRSPLLPPREKEDAPEDDAESQGDANG